MITHPLGLLSPSLSGHSQSKHVPKEVRIQPDTKPKQSLCGVHTITQKSNTNTALMANLAATSVTKSFNQATMQEGESSNKSNKLLYVHSMSMLTFTTKQIAKIFVPLSCPIMTYLEIPSVLAISLALCSFDYDDPPSGLLSPSLSGHSQREKTKEVRIQPATKPKYSPCGVHTITQKSNTNTALIANLAATSITKSFNQATMQEGESSNKSNKPTHALNEHAHIHHKTDYTTKQIAKFLFLSLVLS
jgi:hypothetical protein